MLLYFENAHKYIRVLIFSISINFLGNCTQKNNANEQKTAQTKQDYDCKHCGMPSQDYPQWHAKIELAAQTLWFCSPRCMFSRYHALGAGQARQVWVKDYYTLKFTDATRAHFVMGSKMLGPMGADLVPFAEKQAGQDFSKEHAGKQILSFLQITPQELKRVLE